MTEIISALRDRFTQLVVDKKKSRVYGHIVKSARKCCQTKDGKRQINFDNKEKMSHFLPEYANDMQNLPLWKRFEKVFNTQMFS